MSSQLCRWPGCEKPIDPAHWGCLAHWERLPDNLKGALTTSRFAWAKSGSPSPEWLAAIKAATKWALAERVPSIQTEPSETHVLEDPVSSGHVFPCCFGVGVHKPACRHARR